jgi:hypothetical protein
MLIAAALSMGLAPVIIQHNRAIAARALRMLERILRRRAHPPLDAAQGASALAPSESRHK